MNGACPKCSCFPFSDRWLIPVHRTVDCHYPISQPPSNQPSNTPTDLPCSNIPPTSLYQTPIAIQSVIDRLVWTHGRKPSPLQFRQPQLSQTGDHLTCPTPPKYPIDRRPSCPNVDTLPFIFHDRCVPTPPLSAESLQRLQAPLVGLFDRWYPHLLIHSSMSQCDM